MQTDIAPRTFLRLMAATVTAIGLAWSLSTVALADDFTCTGTVGRDTKDNIQVPDGATCNLNGTMAEGNINVGTGSILRAAGVRVDGNIQAEGAADVEVDNNSTVGGNIQIVQGGAARVVDVTVDGDIQFFENSGQIAADRNRVGGNLQAEENTGGLSINDNNIDGNLQCKANSPPPVGSGNQAASLEDQCAGLGSEGNGDHDGDDDRDDDDRDDDDRDDDDSRLGGEFYGVIQQKPATGLIGAWIIGNITINTTQDTEFKSHSGLLKVGSTVKVTFSTQGDGAHIAKEIKFGFSSRDDHDDDDRDDDDEHGDDRDDDGDDERYGRRPGAEGKAFGRIENKPGTGIFGVWQIGGIDYAVEPSTDLTVNDAYAVGDRVAVEFVERSDQSRLVTRIVTTGDDGGVSQAGNLKLVGFVDSRPQDTLAGEWLVAGVEFTAGADVNAVQAVGILVDSAYVQVEYAIEQNVRRIQVIETDVPPGAGDSNRVGIIESKDGSRAAGASAEATTDATWTINGQSYAVTPSTQVVAGNAELAVGDEVLVNSYSRDSGEEVATRIHAVELTRQLYLPKAER